MDVGSAETRLFTVLRCQNALASQISGSLEAALTADDIRSRIVSSVTPFPRRKRPMGGHGPNNGPEPPGPTTRPTVRPLAAAQ